MEAVQHLEQARRLTGKGGSAWQNLFLAMAYDRLGDAAKSRAAFDRARLARNADWTERLIYRRLRQEAEAVRGSGLKRDK